MAVSATEHAAELAPLSPGLDRPPGRAERLLAWRPDDRLLSWLLTAALGLITLTVRLVGISYPKDLIFDEAYYPPEASELLRFGHEYNRGYYFIVHPPLGKWCIAVGEWLFGYNSLGWRFSSAVASAVTVVILVRVVRRMTRSTFLGLLAGVLLSADGLSFVLGRTGLLDIFLQPFVVGGFACLLVDRDRCRERLARIAAAGPLRRIGPRLGPRGWRLAGGALLGLSCAVKWSGLYFLVGFAVLSVVWDRGARRSAGVRRPTVSTALRDLPGAAWALGVVPVLAYLAAWTGWFMGENSQGRHWAEEFPKTHYPFIPGAIRSLWNMHVENFKFHESLSSSHPWESKPWSWLVDGRPVLMWNPQGLTDSGGGQVVRYILMLGTPALWFAFGPAMAWMVWRVISRRDWRAAAALVGIAAGWLSWFVNLERTMFIFYMAPVVPFFVIAITLALGDVLGRATDSANRRQLGLGLVCLYVALVVVNFGFFYPIFAGVPLSHDAWLQRMWFRSWF